MNTSKKPNLLQKMWQKWQSLYDGHTNINEKETRKQYYPFEIKENPEKGWYVILGSYIVSDAFRTKEEAENEINLENWNFLITVISAIQDINTKQAELKNNITETLNKQ